MDDVALEEAVVTVSLPEPPGAELPGEYGEAAAARALDPLPGLVLHHVLRLIVGVLCSRSHRSSEAGGDGIRLMKCFSSEIEGEWGEGGGGLNRGRRTW